MAEQMQYRRVDIPPLRFAVVEDHPPLYRGSYPHSKNLRFLERLHLKTILSITPEPLNNDIATWCGVQGVKMMHLKASKDKKQPISCYDTKQALQVRHFTSLADYTRSSLLLFITLFTCIVWLALTLQVWLLVVYASFSVGLFRL